MLIRAPLLAFLSFTILCTFVEAAEIAIVKSADLPYYDQAVLGFKAGLPSTVKVKEYNLNRQLARGREIGKSLRAAPPDLIFAVGLKAAVAAKLEIFDTPVVFCMVMNPEAYDLPTSNMTGIAVRPSPDVQLAALRSLMPSRKRIGVLYGEEHTGIFLREAIRVATQQGLELVSVSARSQEDLPYALRGLLPKVDVLWLIQDQVVVSESAIPILLESSLKANVPIFTFSSTLVQQGAVGALVLDPWAVGQQAARQSLTRLKDANALAGTIEAPERSQLALNLRSAEHLEIALSPEQIRLAGQVFDGQAPIAKTFDPFPHIP